MEYIWEGASALYIQMFDVTQNVVDTRLHAVGELKTKLLNSLSHDIKTPLNAIILYSQAASLVNGADANNPSSKPTNLEDKIHDNQNASTL